MAQAKRGLGKGLGRGLGALFGEDVVEEVVMDKRGSHSHENSDSEEERVSRGRKHTSTSNVKSNEKNQDSTSEKVVQKKAAEEKMSQTQSLSGEVEKLEPKTQPDVSRETLSDGSVDRASVLDFSLEQQAIEKQISASEKGEEAHGEIYVKLSKIEPNRSQPRKNFDEEQLQQLADSMKRYGVLQPLLVQKKGDRYELIAGERRWRAAKLAGFREVPVIVREYTRQQTMEIALIENVQRADLNPIEEAKAYQMLIQEFGLRQEDVAERVAKNRATITNSMRLLKLDERVQEMLIQDRLTGGHARALLSLEDGEKQYQLALKTVENHLSVREVERLVKELLKPKKAKKKADPERDMEVFFKDVEEKLKGVMGTKVSINRKDKNKGRIEIEYYSSAELERLIELLESLRQ